MSENNKTKYHFDNYFDGRPINYGKISLIQIGRRYLNENTVIGTHTHLNWFELTIATKGECIVSSNGEESTIHAGDIYVSFPCDLHDIKTTDKELEYDYLSFVIDDSKLSELFNNISLNTSAKLRIFRDERVQFLVSSAISEFKIEKTFRSELLSSIFNQIVIYTMRDLMSSTRSTANVNDSDVLCQQIMNYIDTHVYSIESLNILTDIFSYNYSYLSNLFKKNTSITILDYYTNKRLETAKALIIENKKKIHEIAEMLNYSSTFTFSRAFKKKYGYPPVKMKPNKS